MSSEQPFSAAATLWGFNCTGQKAASSVVSVVSVELISASANGGFCDYKYKIVNALYIITTNTDNKS